MQRPLFISSGDLIADRRYEFAERPREARRSRRRGRSLCAGGRGRAGLCLGLVRARRRAGAARRPRARGRRVRQGARGRSGGPPRRGGAACAADRRRRRRCRRAMCGRCSTSMRRHYDLSLLEGLDYRGPQLLFDAVTTACRDARRAQPYFDRALDLGCGTGLAGAAFWHASIRSSASISPPP